MSREWSFLCALVTLALPSRASAQEPVRGVSTFPDSLSCLAQRAKPEGLRQDSPGRDSTTMPPPTGTATTQSPAIILRASASAREVRFALQPRLEVVLCGGVLDSVRVLERRNLPDPVQPGVTYRDVFIAVEILGHLNAECLVSRITGRPGQRTDVCGSLQLRDTAGAAGRRMPP